MRKLWAVIATIGLVAGSLVGFAGAASAAGTSVSFTGTDPSNSATASLGTTLKVVVTNPPVGTLVYTWTSSSASFDKPSTSTTEYQPKLADKDDKLTVTVTADTVLLGSASTTVHTGSLVFAQSSVAAGSSIDLLGLNFYPGVAYQISSIYATATVTADANGGFTTPIAFPITAKADSYSIAATLPLGKLVAASITVVRPPDKPTMAAATPTITGTIKVGSTLHASEGNWNDDTVFAYQWLRGSSKIPGAIGRDYKATVDDANKSLRVRVVGTAAAATVTATSNSVKVAPDTFSKVPTVTIKGKLKAKRKLKAVTHGSFTPAATTVTYAWYVNGVRIAGAAKSTITVKKSWKKKHITVRITAKRAGFTTVTRSYTTAKKVS